MTGRGVLYALLTVVASAAAMLSFAALRDLALRCGFAPVLAWLLPVVVDAGAAAGSLVWLRDGAAGAARRFARRLALGLLGLSVAANALGHGLAAFVLLPPWWVVVILSGIAPAVLGAIVHLAVLVGRPDQNQPDTQPVALDTHTETTPDIEPPDIGRPVVEPVGDVTPVAGPVQPQTSPAENVSEQNDDGDRDERAAALIAAGAGRRRLSRELGLTEYEARRLLDRTRPTTTTDVPSEAVDELAAAPDAAGSDPVLTGAQS
jgi:hypothetical protein